MVNWLPTAKLFSPIPRLGLRAAWPNYADMALSQGVVRCCTGQVASCVQVGCLAPLGDHAGVERQRRPSAIPLTGPLLSRVHRLHGSTSDLPLVRSCNLARGGILTLPDARKPGEGILPQYGCRCPGCCLADNIRSVHISAQTTMQRLPPQAPPWVRGRMWLPATEGY